MNHKYLIISLFPFLMGFLSFESTNPLASFDPVWKNAQFESCRTAQSAGYLNHTEKEVIFILNLIRKNPQLFYKTVVSKWPDFSGQPYLKTNSYYQSLVKDLVSMKPSKLLVPDSLCMESARCHAIYLGEAGETGHSRRTAACSEVLNFRGECIHYGEKDPLQIVMDLLIDEDIVSLGHRKICLSNDFGSLGLSMQHHKVYGTVMVMDFGR